MKHKLKVEIIRSCDVGCFSRLVEDFCNNRYLDHIDTHTEMMPNGRNEIVYIAIIFYKEEV